MLSHPLSRFKEAFTISIQNGSAYPALDRAAFLIERTCVPRYYPPRYCVEAAQLLAMLEAVRQRGSPQKKSGQPSDT